MSLKPKCNQLLYNDCQQRSQASSSSNVTTSITTCVQTAQSGIYVLVLNDSSGAALEGVQIAGNVKWLCGSYAPPGYFVATQNISATNTSSDGTLFIGSIVGNYSLTLPLSCVPISESGKD